MVADIALGVRRPSSGKFELVDAGDAAWVSRGTGAQLKTLFERDQDVVWVTDFMTPEQQADAFNGTLLFDHQPAIQRAIDYAMYRDLPAASNISGGPRVRCPGGRMRIDRPIQVGYGVDFRSIAFEGEGRRYPGNAGAGTAFICSFNNAPGVVVQGGRNVVLRGFHVEGLNIQTIVNILAAPAMTDLLVSNWIDPTFPAASSSRYAPYAGIAIDPYSGPRPAVSYPDVSYPAFLGAVPQYGKEFSSETKIEEVSIWGFVVGVAQQPCDADGNGDFTNLHNVGIFFCAYAMAWGNSQSRVIDWDRCDVTAVHTGVATTVFGKQQGEPQIAFLHCSFNAMIRLLDMPNLNFGQGPAFYHCFCEAVYSIGRAGQAADVSGAVLFDDCQLGFSWWGRYGVPVYVYDNEANAGLTTFRDTTFYLTGLPDNFVSLGFESHGYGGSTEAGRNYRFEGCQLVLGTFPSQLWQKCALNATVGFSFRGLQTFLSGYHGMRLSQRYDLDAGTNLSSALFDEINFGARATCLPVYGKVAKSLLFGTDPGVPNLWREFGFAAVGAITQVGRNIQFSNPGITVDFLAQSGGDVGDIIQSNTTRAVFVVYARTGTTISARAQTGFDGSGNLLTPLPNNDAFSTLSCRRYCPGPDAVVWGNITAGSNVVTDLVLGNGGAPNLPSLFTVGDHWYIDTDYDRIIDAFGDNRITAIDNVLKTITFAGNFLLTRTRIRLGLFTRAPMPNGTPT